MNKIRRMFWDIETSPNIGYFWRPGYKINIGPENLIKERAIICIAWKWEGEKRVHYGRWLEGNDENLVEVFLKEVHNADEMVAHFGDKFDMPWFKGRCAFYGFNDFPIVKTVDTCQLANRNFNFNSNKLDYLARHLCGVQKIETGGFRLWKDVMSGDEKALSRMIKYCKNDVVILEKVYHAIQPFIRQATHVGVLNNLERWTCPACGADEVKKDKTRVTAAGMLRHQFRCNKCFKYYTIPNNVYEMYRKRYDN